MTHEQVEKECVNRFWKAIGEPVHVSKEDLEKSLHASMQKPVRSYGIGTVNTWSQAWGDTFGADKIDQASKVERLGAGSGPRVVA